MSPDSVTGFFCEGIDEWFDVTAWPRWMRRTFLLTFPVSAPIYMAAFFATLVAFIASFLAAVFVVAWK